MSAPLNQLESANLIFLHKVVAQAQSYGMRRLLVISGQRDWCYSSAKIISQHLIGDWLTTSTHTSFMPFCLSPDKAHSLLGREFKHAIVDATVDFHADALAAITGTLLPGSLLVLLVPEWQKWQQQVDEDSLRWSEQQQAIPTPNFVSHLQDSFSAEQHGLIWQQGQTIQGTLLESRNNWQPPNGQPTSQQQAILDQLIHAPDDYYLLTAHRGRGKSALAGMLARQSVGECWLTGPNKTSVDEVIQWADNQIHFIAPDALLALCEQNQQPKISWLIVDEAAAIPMSILHQLTTYFPRILFTTTVLGYEGTGRGFLLKFCVGLPHYQKLELSMPVRWNEGDVLETIINQALLLNVDYSLPTESRFQQIAAIAQTRFITEKILLNQFYGLLMGAHYRTTPLDLRRLLDAPNSCFWGAFNQQSDVMGALWGIYEGGLTEPLAHEVWAGRRRPKGNLVAQSLSAHAGLYQAPILRSLRISRVAVSLQHRRQQIARQLIMALVEQAQHEGLDYVSVSFGYSDELLAFWQACGFKLIHIGSQKEASSGCYAAMAILPLTAQGSALLTNGLVLLNAQQQASLNVPLSEQEWLELAGFAFAYRTLESAKFALRHLLSLVKHSDTPALTAYFEQHQPIEQIAATLNLTGRKALLIRWREETAKLLSRYNEQKIQALQHWVNHKID